MKLLHLTTLLAAAGRAYAPPPPPAPVQGEACSASWNHAAEKWNCNGANGVCCDDDLTCFIENDNGSSDPQAGVCQSETCAGVDDSDSTDFDAQDRVTICHRTSSASNPWVRITVDRSAWDGTDGDCEAGGHQAHSANGQSDYIVKEHDASVIEAMSNPDQKAYWKIWNKACPAARGTGGCCGTSGQGDDLGPCCGDVTESCPELGSLPLPSSSFSCPNSILSEVTVVADSPATEDFLLGQDIVYHITSDDGGNSVSFKIFNPFEAATKVYVQYHKPLENFDYAYADECDLDEYDSSCPTESTTTITAQCLASNKKTWVSVWFSTEAPGYSGSSEIDTCCYPDPETVGIQYVFVIDCECAVAAPE